MKKLLTLLFSLLFLSSSSVFADDISDFEIEGISIGDSLLDYMTEDEILEEIENTKYWYQYLNEPNKYAEVNVLTDRRKYDFVSVFIKNTSINQYMSKKDEKFTILAIRGSITKNINSDSCIKERDEIIEIFSQLLPNRKKTEHLYSNGADPSGESIIDAIHLDKLPSEGVRIACVYWEENYRIKNNFLDNLSVVIETGEIIDWTSDY